MGKRITSLQEITTVTDNDFIPVDNQSSGVRKLSAGFLNDIEDALDGKQDALTAGANINIAQDGTISATDTTYTAGTNVDITNGVISATDTDTDALSELTDTAISSPSDGDALVYDSTSGKWVNGGVASDIGDLNDVDITTPTDGQVLSYDATNQEWVNADAGSDVSVTQIQSSGTKIATVTVDNVDTDLYAPTPIEVEANPQGTGSTDLTKIDVGGTIYNIPSGGGGGSTSSYGYTNPSSSSGSDGDIYNKIEDVTGTDETVTTPVSVTTNTTFQFPKSISEYSTITVIGSNGGTDFEPQTVAVENIGADMNHQTYIGTSGVLWYKTTDSVVMWATNAEITSCYGTYTNSHKIVDIYQKTSNSWSKYEDKGSIVVANPSGTATTDLEKISIDGTIYDIPSGGGSGYEETVLWDDILTPDISGSDITLSDAVTNYNQLLFVLKPANSTEITYAYFPVSELEVSGTYGIIAIGGYSTYAYFTYNSATSLNIKSWASADKTQYQKIIGIKFGSGSGGGGFSIIDEIWTGNETPPTTGTVITLTEKWNDYDFLCFLVTNTTASDAPYSTPIIMTKDMAIDTKNLQAAYSYNRFDVVVTPKSDTTLQIERPSSSGTAVIYKKIYGIKLGSGGSSGGGNLYGTTDPTNDLGNNGDIYMKYQGGSEPVEGETETLTNVYLEITKENDWVALPNFDASLYYSIIFNHSSQVLSTKINISDISTDANNPTIFGNTYDDLYGYINNSTLYLKTVIWNNTINSAIVTLNVFQPPQILNTYGKVEDEWVGFGGGSSGGGNLYGTTDPTSDLGSNGDIYMKYGHRYVNTSFISSTTSIPWGSTLDVTITDMDTYDSLHIEGKCMISGYSGQTFDEEWVVDDIPSDSSTAVRVTANSDCFMYRDGDTLKFYNTVTGGVIDSLEGAKADAPYIVGEYGKIEGEWCNFPGYSETVLWSGNETINAWVNPYTVDMSAESILNTYDELIFVSTAYAASTSDEYFRTTSVKTSVLKEYIGKYLINPFVGDAAHNINIYYDTTNDRIKLYGTTNYGYVFLKLIGIKYGNGGGSGSSSHNYSTDEQVVGTWIDGKPVYEKSFEVTMASTNGNAEISLSSYLPSSCEIINRSIFMRYKYQNHDYQRDDYNVELSYDYDTGYFITLHIGSGALTDMVIPVTVQYTKTI